MTSMSSAVNSTFVLKLAQKDLYDMSIKEELDAGITINLLHPY